MVGTSEGLREGSFISDRYRIIRQIGQGGFGRTYLAEDTNRYRERCVLKEFVPSVDNDADLQKAEELFEREAGILYKLKHDRIPEFKALVRTRVDRKRCLFLVQEYIEGETYQEKLKDRGSLNESEVIELILELLPVLEYIHEQNLIHRDISPDNLIYRYKDKKPVLIDFGCVKEAANAVSRSQGHLVTLIGKKGYAPEEQMRHGKAFPCSDLYSLAATAIVLLTGQNPDSLYDAHSGKWLWEQEVKVSGRLAKVLNKMLAHSPSDRYSSATEVIEAVNNNSLVNSWFSHLQTFIVAPKNKAIPPEATPEANITKPFKEPSAPVPSSISRLKTQAVAKSQAISRIVSGQVQKVPVVRDFRPWQWALVFAAALVLPGMFSFSLLQRTLSPDSQGIFSRIKLPSIGRSQPDIFERVEALNINQGVFFARVDREFHRRYPEMKGVALSDRPEHQSYRREWMKIADELLQQQGG